MNQVRLFSALVGAFVSTYAFSYGTGQSSFPLSKKMKFMAAEFSGIFNQGKGAGAQFRYTQKISSRVVMDGGMGVSGGDRSHRFFVGADYEIFPDYMKQPRFSVKANLERASEFDVDRNILTLAPIVSKGFSFWGKPAYPFISFPLGLSLDGGSSTYESLIAASIGVTSNIPIKSYQHLTTNLELNLNIKNSFTGLFLGIGYPIK